MSKFEINDSKKLLESLSSLYSFEETMDVTFVVANKKVSAHRLVLACQSDFFLKLLFDNKFKEGKLEEIPLEAPLEAFELLLSYMYTAKLSLESFGEKGQVYSDLLDLARRFNVQGLENNLVNYFLKSVKPENVLEILKLAVLYDLVVLKETCINLMSETGTDAFIQDSIIGLPLATLKELLSSPLVTKTIDQFYALQKWLSQNSCFDSTKEELAKLIDVSKLSSEQIITVLAPSKLFEDGFLLKKLMERNTGGACKSLAEMVSPKEEYKFTIKVGRVETVDGINMIYSRDGFITLELEIEVNYFSFKATDKSPNAIVYAYNKHEDEDGVEPSVTKEGEADFIYQVVISDPFNCVDVLYIEPIYDIQFGIMHKGILKSAL